MEKTKTKLAYSVLELAELLSIGRAAAYELTKTDGFPAIPIGRRIVIPVAPLEMWLERQARSSGEAAGR